MSTKKHTPGPWKLFAGGTIKPWAQVRAPHENGGDRIITDTTGWGQYYSEATANAARIVACVNACEGIEDPSTVPELLAYAKEAHADDPHDDGRCAFCAVLARAEGRKS